jgi:hypothetical protein
MRGAAFLASLLLATVCAAGEPDPLADCGGPAAHGFDFWLGTWIVHTADGACAGENRITREPGSCRIDEAWTGARGGSGRSVNFLDPVSGRWRQLWHAPGGVFIDIEGGPEEPGTMVLEGVIHYGREGRTAPFRGHWTTLPDGRVRQFFEEREPESGSWSPWFEGFYTRMEEGGAACPD